MIAALWSNSNWDDDKGSRSQAIEGLEESFSVACDMVMTGVRENEAEIDKDDPFFAAAERGLEKIEMPRNDEGTVGDVVDEDRRDFQKYIDQ